ncbi:MAG: hypothetical protein WAL80_09070 [Xanthobacteraceae bacterium]
MTSRSVATLIAVALIVGAAGSAGAEVLRRILASPLVEEGSGPDGCTPVLSGLGGPVRWEVRVERFLPDGKSLVEASHIAEPNRFPLCIADRPVAKNAEVELPFVAHAGGSARVAGVVLRFSDPQDFYVVEADGLAGQVRLLSIVNGERRDIAGHAASLTIGEAHMLTVKATDEHFAVALDGTNLFAVRDGGLTAPGRLGIWSRADSITSFGDLYITILD